jgi:hypothetical protein
MVRDRLFLDERSFLAEDRLHPLIDRNRRLIWLGGVNEGNVGSPSIR